MAASPPVNAGVWTFPGVVPRAQAEPAGLRAPAISSSLFLLGQLPRLQDCALRPFLHLLAHRPIIFPDRIFRMARARIGQGDGPLPIFDQRPVGKLVKLANQPAIESLRLVGVPAGLETNQGLAQ